MNEGYIRIERKILDWGWYRNINTKVLFLHMILRANWEEGFFEGHTIPRGSFVSSIKNLAFETGLTENEVRQAIKHLKLTNEITSKSTNKFTVFTVKNYDLYQADNKQNNKRVTNKSQTINKQLTTIEKEKEYINKNNIFPSNEVNIYSCSELKNSEPKTENIAIELPLNDNSQYPVSHEAVQEWAELYPAVNVIQQLRAMKGWLIANPTKRKTRRGVAKFINAWLSREQDKGNKPVASQPVKKNMTTNYEQREWDFNALEKLKREELRRNMEA